MRSIVAIAYELGLPTCAETLARDRTARTPFRDVRNGASTSLLSELTRLGPSPARVRSLLEHSSREAHAWIADDVFERILWLAADESIRTQLGRASVDSAASVPLLSGTLTAGEATDALASRVANAHLPRLACSLLPRNSLAQAAEILLDAELTEALPDLGALAGSGSPEELELAGYVAGRIDVVRDLAAVAARIDDSADVDYRRLDANELLRFARSHLLRADVAVRIGSRKVPPEAIDYIADRRPSWRYAQFVRLLAALATSDERAWTLLDGYLDRFGNQAPLWRSLFVVADHRGRGRLQLRLCAEIAAAPQDAVPWAALVDTLDAPDAAAELAKRRQSGGKLES